MGLNEENIKIKKVLEFIYSLGFIKDELQFENNFHINLGKYTYKINTNEQVEDTNARLDILVRRNQRNLFIIEVKREKQPISKNAIDQCVSYARLVHPISPFCIITNGKDTKIIDTITKEEIDKNKFVLKDSYEITISEDLRMEALENFLGYSKENLEIFCKKQVDENMKLLVGSTNDRNKKYISELYESPKEIDEQFKKFIDSEKKCFFISGSSGIGKTCWICDTTFFLIKNKYPTFFYRAVELSSLLTIFTALLNDLSWNFSSQYNEIKAMKHIIEIFKDSKIFLLVDGIDEYKDPNEFKRIIEESIKRTSEYKNIKFVLTCKKSYSDCFLKDKGVYTNLHHEMFNHESYIYEELEEEQFKKMIEKYRNFYGFYGNFEEKIISDCKRDAFLFRVMFEVASSLNKSIIGYSTSELYKEYLKGIYEKICNDKIKFILLNIAGVLFDKEIDYISEDEYYKASSNTIMGLLPQELFDFGILERNEIEFVTYIRFYNQQIRDFLISFQYLKLHHKTPEELVDFFNYKVNSEMKLEILNFYYKLAKLDHKMAFDKEVRNNATKYTKLYEDTISKHFFNFKSSFSPNTNNQIGMVGCVDLKKREIVRYGFRPIKPKDEKILLIPYEKVIEGNKNIFSYGVRVVRYKKCLNGFRNIADIKSLVMEEILRELKDIMKKGLLDESQNKNLMIERIIALLINFYAIELNIQMDKISPLLPMELDFIKTLISNNTKSAKNPYYRYDIINLLLLRDIENLKKIGVSEISEPIHFEKDGEKTGVIKVWDLWKPTTLQMLIHRLYDNFLNEYPILIKRNFPTIYHNFYFYKNMPIKILLNISYTQTFEPVLKSYFCKEDSTLNNSVLFIEKDDFIYDPQNFVIKHSGKIYNIFLSEEMLISGILHPSDYFLPLENFRNPILLNRSMIYNKLNNDIKEIFEKNCKLI